MTDEKRFGVWLYAKRIGTLTQRGDYTWFNFRSEYLEDPLRSVLGLHFEDNLTARHAAALRLPPWFSNLLPEGKLREWIARDRGVSVSREMELLAQVGSDLPGAVRILAQADESDYVDEEPDFIAAQAAESQSGDGNDNSWRFSLAGVGLKFSMVQDGDRLTLPAHGEGGDWIVKLPDSVYDDVPLNEHAMMTLAQAVGIDVPEHMIVSLDLLKQLPDRLIANTREGFAYAVRRFDRPIQGQRVHIEDFAQVRNFYPLRKYDGSFETVAALAYRGRDHAGLLEVVRRLTLNVLISNGDAHLKNWSLIYTDKRSPRLAPVYDLVSTALYRVGDGPEDLGLRLGRSKRFGEVTLGTFERLGDKLAVSGAELAECARDIVDRVTVEWPRVASLLDSNARIRDGVAASIEAGTRSLLGGGLSR